MRNRLRIIFFALSFLFSNSLLYGQEESAPAAGGDDVFKETFSDLTMIGYMGAGGAILGLSTLSFVDRPSQNLKNIVVGGAIGVIVGVGVVAWRQATKSQESYGMKVGQLQEVALLENSKGPIENNKEERFLRKGIGPPIALNWNFDF